MDGKALMLGVASLLALVVGLRRLGARHYTDASSRYDPQSYPQSAKDWQETVQRNLLQGTSFLGVIDGNGAVDTQHRHGRRSTLIYIPPTFDPTRPWTLVYYFHGLTGFKLGKDVPGGGYERDWMPATILDAQSLGENFVIVFPEMPWSYHTVTPTKRQRSVFDGTSDEDFLVWDRGVRTVLSQDFGISTPPAHQIYIGHSAGGSTLRAISNSGALNSNPPDLIIWSDAAYGTWLDEFYRNFINDRNTEVVMFNLVDTSATKPYKQTLRFIAQSGKPASLEVKTFTYGDGWYHRKIGYNALRMAFEHLRTGK